MRMDMEIARRHYAEHVERPFFVGLAEFMTSRPILATRLKKANEAVSVVRDTMGATDPRKAAPGTIRGDLAQDIGRNLIHGSDSVESAERELGIFFSDGEILGYDRETERWITES